MIILGKWFNYLESAKSNECPAAAIVFIWKWCHMTELRLQNWTSWLTTVVSRHQSKWTLNNDCLHCACNTQNIAAMAIWHALPAVLEGPALLWSSCKDSLDIGLMTFCSNTSSMSDALSISPQSEPRSICSKCSFFFLCRKIFCTWRFFFFLLLPTRVKQKTNEKCMLHFCWIIYATWHHVKSLYSIKAFITFHSLFLFNSSVPFIRSLQVTTAFIGTLLATSM